MPLTTDQLIHLLDVTPAGALPLRHRTMLMTLALTHARREATSTRLLMARAGVNPKSLYRTLRELEAAGWIARKGAFREDGGYAATEYAILRGGPVKRERIKAWPAQSTPKNP